MNAFFNVLSFNETSFNVSLLIKNQKSAPEQETGPPEVFAMVELVHKKITDECEVNLSH